jgi:serine/threonine protein kinase/Tol biopolymer transport system component
MIGKTLAHYEITSLLGKGGMGEVYQAKDLKLGRDVAIKVLPEEFAKDADRVARFQREAKLLASLNHPNIAAIHGLEESDGTHFLVLELIEGDSLADRIKAGAIPVEESLKLALQIAEALEAAHEKGVIHRDLKPANIKVTPDGKVKVLDFGLAKAFAGDHADLNLSNSPTLSHMATQQGVILGTAAYMSPEQAKGRTVDKRADIWAFGAVLFEMLTGRQLFTGETVSETLAAVLMREPDFSKLPQNLHPKILEALKRCLEKEARNRYSGISDSRVDIQDALADPSGVLVQPVAAVEPRKKLRIGLSWVAAALVLGLIIAGVAVWKLKPPEPKQVIRFEYELPAGQQFNRNPAGAVRYQFAVSPDGSQFVYSTTEGLYLRSMDALNARLIAGTDKDTFLPFFSPDGQWIGYFSGSDQKLKKVAVSGGAPVVLCDTSPMVNGASWDSKDTILYSDRMTGIMRVSANGGTPEVLVKGRFANMSKEGFPYAPQMLPDGKTLLFTNAVSLTDINNDQIVIQSLKSGEQKIVFKGGAYARYLPTGDIIYTLTDKNIRNLFAVPFDLDKLEVTGSPVSVLEGVADGAYSDSGTLVYVPQPAVAAGATNTASSGNTLVWVDRQGKEKPLSAVPEDYRSLKISPDGTRVALSIVASGNQDIWVWDIPHKTPTRLTFDKASDFWPIWTADSKWIVFASGRGGGLARVYWKSADGIGEAELLGSKPNNYIVPGSFSRDGKILAVSEFSLSSPVVDIGMLSMEGKREMKELLQEKQEAFDPQISPDGRYMAYQSDESGKFQIYVRSFPDMTKGKWQVSSGGGNSPLWSPDGRELFYRSGDATMAVEVEKEPTFKRGNPKTLFQGTYFFANIMQKIIVTPWDISPDGKKFLMIKPGASTAAAPTAAGPQPKIIVVTNWFEELKQRVPVKQ